MSSPEVGVKQAPAPLEFKLPVDSEMKATKIVIYSIAQPHMRAFHLSWIIFFFTFFATFAPAVLIPIIREDMSLTKTDLGISGVTAVCGAIGMRVIMGFVLDIIGPRFGNAMTMLLFAPAVFCMSLVQSAGDFQCVRLFIGCSLCAFVTCQFWVGSMFNVKIVGTANAITAGWGNMGGGATALLMPLMYEGIADYVPAFHAWRYAFFIPGGIFVLLGVVSMLFSQDAPQGDYRMMKETGQLTQSKGNIWAVAKCGLLNYRSWICFMTYGYCFGVELTVDNLIVDYLYDQFQLDHMTAGGLGALFGLMNLFSRASGGMLSDLAAIPWGMRGRLWVLFTLQLLGGVFCLALGLVDYDLTATIVVMIIFSIFCQQACGATFGVVPFISRRAYGVVSGLVGAGGNVGSVVTQTIFFQGSASSPDMTKQDGLVWMGVMIMGITFLICFIHFPMWGSMFFPANPDVSEEDYYLREWNADEVAQGLHTPSLRFAMESKSNRGSQRGAKAKAEAAAAITANEAEIKPAAAQ
eukprot:gene21321-28253_t